MKENADGRCHLGNKGEIARFYKVGKIEIYRPEDTDSE
jgi:hypothetical protein